MVDVDIDAALHYPFEGDDVLLRFAIGGGVPSVLSVVSLVLWILTLIVPVAAVLFVPMAIAQLAFGLLLTGYFVRVAQDALAGKGTPPSFEDWGGLLSDGLRGFLIMLVYQVPMVVLGGAGMLAMVAIIGGAGALGDEGAAAALGVLGVVGIFALMAVTAAYSLVMAYLLPVSLVAYAAEGRVGAAFSLDRVKPVAFSGEYFVPWLVVAGIYMTIAGVVSFLTQLLIGFLLVPLLPLAYFFLGTMGMAMFAQAYANEHEVATPSTDASSDVTDTTSSRPMQDL